MCEIVIGLGLAIGIVIGLRLIIGLVIGLGQYDWYHYHNLRYIMTYASSYITLSEGY
jgi:hypothetical protein